MTRTALKQGNNPYHHGDLRGACISVALELLLNQGIQEVTLRHVAKRAGVSHNAPYRHFKTKRDLLGACAAQGFVMLERAVTEAVEAVGANPIEQLFAGSQAYALFGANHPPLYKLMFSSDLSDTEFPEIGSAGTTAFGVPVKFLKAAQATGIVRKADARVQAFTLWSVLHGIVSLNIDSRPTQIVDTDALDANLRGVLAVLLEGLMEPDANSLPKTMVK